MSSSEFEAEAQIKISADAKAFLKTLDQLGKLAEKKSITITLKVNDAAFRKSLDATVKSAAGKTTAKILVEPLFTGFVTKLKKGVADATKNVVARIPVEVGKATRQAAATAPAARATPAAVSRAAAPQRQTREEISAGFAAERLKKEEAATKGVVAANKILADSETKASRQTSERQQTITRLNAAEKALEESRKARDLASKTRNTELQAQTRQQVADVRQRVTAEKQALSQIDASAAAQKKAKEQQAAADKIGRSQSAAIAENTRRDTAARQAAAKQEQQIAKEIDAAFKSREKERADATSAAQKRSRDFFSAQANAEKASAQEAKAAARAQINEDARIEKEREDLFKKEVRAKQQTAKQVEKIDKTTQDRIQANRLKTQGLVNQLAGTPERARLTTSSEVGRTSQILRTSVSLDKRATDQLTAAEALLAKSQTDAAASAVAEAAALKKKTAASVVSAEAAHNDALAEANRSRQQRFAARGFIAQLASFAGLRGAVLAASGAFIGGTTAAIAFGKAIADATKFESDLNVFAATTGATADQIARVDEEAKKLGSDITLPGVGVTDAAEAMQTLAKAGLSVQDSLTGARGVLQLSTAAQIDNAEATELVASALNAFQLSGKEATRVADVFTNSANLSQGSITDVAVAFQQASAVAHQAGLTFEETATLLTIMQRAGIKGSDAGTALRVALTRLIAPGKKARAVLKDLGVEIRDASGNLNPRVFSDFVKAESGLSIAAKQANAVTVFGVDAQRVIAVLGRESEESFGKTSAAIEQTGSTAKVASARMAGAAGAAESLKNSISTLSVVAGEFVLGPLAGLTRGLAKLITEAQKAGTSVAQALKAQNVPAEPQERGLGDRILGGLEDAGKKAVSTSIFDVIDTLATQADAVSVAPFSTKSIDELNKGFLEASKNVDDIHTDLVELSKVKTKDDQLGIKPMLFGIKVLKENFIGTNEEIQAAREKLDAVARFLVAVGRAPTKLELEVLLKRGGVDKQLLDLEKARKIPIEILPHIAGTAALENSIVFTRRKLVKELGEDAPKDAAEKFAEGFETTFQKKFDPEHLFTGDLGAFEASGKKIGDAWAAAITGAVQRGLNVARTAINNALTATGRNARLAIGRIDDQLQDVELAGDDPRKRLALLRQKETEQERLVQLATGPRAGRKNLGREEIRRRKQDLAQTRSGIKSAQQEISSAQEKALQEAEDARNKADQDLLDRLSRGRRAFDQRIAAAQATATQRDDIPALQAMRKRLLSEKKQVSDGVKDSKTKTAQLLRLDDELADNLRQIGAARTGLAQEIADAFATKAQAKIDLGEATGDFRLLIQGLNDQITIAKQALSKALAAKTGILAAKAAVAQAAQAKREMIQSAKDTLLQTAFDIAETKSNKSLMLAILDIQIKNANAEIRAARNLQERLDAQLKLAQLTAKKQEVLKDEAEKDKGQGTTVFDLLKENVAAFNANAGNLINGDQPFVGPTGFTADVAQFLKRRKPIGAGVTRAAAGGTWQRVIEDVGGLTKAIPSAADKQVVSNNALINAINRWIAVVNAQSGNQSTGVPTFPTKGTLTQKEAGQGKRWFIEGHWARGAQDS